MRTFINFFLIFFSVSCNTDKAEVDNGWDVIISGKISNPQQGIILVQELKNDGTGKRDSVKVKGNTYSKKIHLTEPGIYGLNFFGKQSVNLMVDHANIELNVD